ncbi:BamA/TamA family outer membrane protein, partial [Candidatus Pelagibacter sp.]|nr:BamA/TamA family outer membrane protein [Candidatus Pelagibacter sp.]
KIINISVIEKPTGELSAGAGVGTSGTTTTFGIKENNYLGNGISLNANLEVSEETIKGRLSMRNPNFNNSDKAIHTNFQSFETDRLSDFGYKTNKTGFTVGTDFEYYDDLTLGLGINSYYEDIETDSTASSQQQKLKGNYFDNFISLSLDYDKRNQKFQTSQGFRNYFSTDLPVISETNTFANTFITTNYYEYFNNNILKSSFYFRNANSISGKNIKLSERLTLPSNRLRGFERGKVGPKDGNDFIGGNYMASLNFSSDVPKILENSQSTDLKIFLDIANVWGVDYDSSLETSDDIKSAIGLGLDWFTPVGPLNFTLSQHLSKGSNDITESFRFNLGTSF